MSKVGEAYGGHGRFFGGINRKEILDQRWLYAHFHPDGGATIANYGQFALKPFRGVHIDAIGESAYATFAIPRDFHVLDEFTLLYVNHNAGISSVSIAISSKTCAEDLATDGVSYARDLPEFGATTLRCEDLLPDLGGIEAVPLAADDLFGIAVEFGGDIDADVTLFGVILKYH